MAGVEMQGVGVTVTQPGAAAPSGVWHDDLFSCMADPGFCMYTCCCPACAFGQAVESSLGTNCVQECCLGVIFDCGCGIYHIMKRGEFRAKYGGLPEAPCCDIAVGCLCSPCSTCQMQRHYKSTNP